METIGKVVLHPQQGLGLLVMGWRLKFCIRSEPGNATS